MLKNTINKVMNNEMVQKGMEISSKANKIAGIAMIGIGIGTGAAIIGTGAAVTMATGTIAKGTATAAAKAVAGPAAAGTIAMAKGRYTENKLEKLQRKDKPSHVEDLDKEIVDIYVDEVIDLLIANKKEIAIEIIEKELFEELKWEGGIRNLKARKFVEKIEKDLGI